MIQTEGLTRRFGDLTAVDNLTLTVGDSEVFGFLGPNGAGKTTTVRMLACLIGKTSGTARIGEYEIGKEPDEMKIRSIIGFLPENVGLYEELSAYDNLEFYGRLYKLPESKRKERIEYFLKLLGLWERRSVSAGTFSKGMKQKLAIARALIHDPQVLFLDEPTANLDPEASKTVRDFILELKREKRTIFLNTHLLDEAERVCDRVGILKTSLLTVGSPMELRQSLRGRRTEIQLERIDDKILSAVKRLGPKNIDAKGNKLLIGVDNPEEENPDIVAAIGSAGGRVQFVTEVSATLEDVYLNLVKG
jgi:ABC-2 type transport system ATP-binding protein